MKKYKLLKDLPLAKAGTIVRLEDISIQSSIKLIFEVNKSEHPLCAIYKKEINEWLEEIQEKPKSIWDLKRGDKYFYLDLNDTYSKISDFIIYDEFDLNSYKDDLENGNIFLTREEAQKELNKRQAIQRIKKFCFENNIELADREFITDDRNRKHTIIFNFHKNNFMSTYYEYFGQLNIFVFKNFGDVIRVINNCEADLRIIFDV